MADTFALAALCEALGAGVPTVVVPMVSNKLWGHPAWAGNLDTLARAGAALMNIHTGEDGPARVQSGTGDEVVARFDPGWVTARLRRLVSG